MKKLFIIIASALSLCAFMSCSEKENIYTSAHDIIISGPAVIDNALTKTSIAPNPDHAGYYKPSWVSGDASALFLVQGGTGIKNNIAMNVTVGDGGVASKFSATVSSLTAGTYDLYAAYPRNITSSNNTYNKYQISIPTYQYPTATSFDGAGDILIATKKTIDVASSPVETNFAFTRVNSVVLINIPTSEISASGVSSTEKIEKVVFTAGASTSDYVLTGSAYYDLSTAALHADGFFAEQSNSVIAQYLEANQFNLGDGQIFLLVNPFILTADKSLTIEITTDTHVITRTVTSAEKDFTAGNITKINLAIGSDCTVATRSSESLPWSVDFSSVVNNLEWKDLARSESNPEFAGKFVYSNKIFFHNYGVVKFGNSSEPGILVSQKLNLNNAFTVKIYASGASATEKTFYVKAGGEEKSFICDAIGTTTNPGDILPYHVTFDAKGAVKDISIYTKQPGLRGYIQKIEVVEGTSASPICISPSTLKVGAAAASDTTLTLNQYRNASYTATVSYDGTVITSASLSEGTLTYSLSANTGNTREGWIRLTYNDSPASICTISVTQYGSDKAILDVNTFITLPKITASATAGTITDIYGKVWPYLGYAHTANNAMVTFNAATYPNGYIQTPASTKTIKTITIRDRSAVGGKFYHIQNGADTGCSDTPLAKVEVTQKDLVIDISSFDITSAKIFCSGTQSNKAFIWYAVIVEYE